MEETLKARMLTALQEIGYGRNEAMQILNVLLRFIAEAKEGKNSNG